MKLKPNTDKVSRSTRVKTLPEISSSTFAGCAKNVGSSDLHPTWRFGPGDVGLDDAFSSHKKVPEVCLDGQRHGEAGYTLIDLIVVMTGVVPAMWVSSYFS